jgi:hypothetical protein
MGMTWPDRTPVIVRLMLFVLCRTLQRIATSPDQKARTQNLTTSQTPCMMHEAKAERMQILGTAGKRFASN